MVITMKPATQAADSTSVIEKSHGDTPAKLSLAMHHFNDGIVAIKAPCDGSFLIFQDETLQDFLGIESDWYEAQKSIRDGDYEPDDDDEDEDLTDGLSAADLLESYAVIVSIEDRKILEAFAEQRRAQSSLTDGPSL